MAQASSEHLRFARQLRRRMTHAETLVWNALRRNGLSGFHFRRQVPIGRFVVDFLCAPERLIVELDGAPHEREEQQAHDAARDEWLRAEGYTILRLKNDLVIGGGDIPLQMIAAEAERLKRLRLCRERG